MANLKLALRNLLKAPFVSFVAVVSLALGIGANAATFSLLHQILLRPLPVQEPTQLVNLAAPGPKPGMQSSNDAGDTDVVFSYPMLRDLQSLEELQAVFTGIAGHRSFGANLAYNRQTLDGQGMLVSGSYFPVLGLQPALGRLLGPQDDQTFGGHFVVVLSHAYWQSRFAASTDVIGETLIVNGQHMTIIGVAPQGFSGTTLGSQPQIFVPISMHGLMVPQWNDRMVENRRAYWVYLFARRGPGISMEQAQAAINVQYHAIINEVEAPLQEGMSEQTLARFKSKEIQIEDGRRGQSSVHQDGRAPVLLLFAVTAVVLLIACANIANLLLARSASRTTEIAVRISLGANRLQLLRQLLVESCLLAVLGGLAGLIVARWTLGLIGSLLPAEAIDTIQLGLSPAVVTFVALLSFATGIFFGLFPALHSIRPDLVLALREGSTQPSSSRAASRFRSSLATVQIAMSMALLISAGLFAKSLLNVNRVDIGVEVDGLTLFSVSPELSGYSADDTRILFEQIEDELAALPGVTSVTASLVPIISGSSWGSSVSVEGFEAGPDTDRNSRFNEVGPDYFRTLGIPLTAGRDFTRADTLDAAKVAIVNDVFAKKFNIEGDTVGKRMQIGGGGELDIEIVGLMPSTKYNRVKAETPPIFLIPYRQDEQLGFLTFYIRSELPAEQMFASIRGVIRRLDANLPIEELKTMSEQIRENVFLDRMISTLTSAFAALATILAAVGLYGVLAYSVAQRTREIGLRMALGADTGRVRKMVLASVGWMTLIGGVLGLAAAIGLGRVAQSLLFEVKAHDPLVILYSTALLVVIALAAGFIPALRASKIDPMVALRYE
jgi:predicted permease